MIDFEKGKISKISKRVIVSINYHQILMRNLKVNILDIESFQG